MWSVYTETGRRLTAPVTLAHAVYLLFMFTHRWGRPKAKLGRA
jgi:hypothetical protein